MSTHELPHYFSSDGTDYGLLCDATREADHAEYKVLVDQSGRHIIVPSGYMVFLMSMGDTISVPANGTQLEYRHYKGGLYKHICEATSHADNQAVIVYEAHDKSIWLRPKSVFFENVEMDGQSVQRFVPI